jgi:hypothetical protein
MRYQGDEMASTEIEARGRWSLLGTAGFRYQLARLFGMHAGVDVGFSSGETAIYLQVRSAWFRP